MCCVEFTHELYQTHIQAFVATRYYGNSFENPSFIASLIIANYSLQPLSPRTDLVEVCRHLGYDDDYADDILAQIGQDGFISYDAFAQFNRALLSNDVSFTLHGRMFSAAC